MRTAVVLGVVFYLNTLHLNAADNLPGNATDNCALNTVVDDIFISLPETRNLTNSVLEAIGKLEKLESEVRQFW